MANRGRPPRLERRVVDTRPAPPATPQQLLERAKVAGPMSVPGPTELRRFVERIVAGDRYALGELAPIPTLTVVEAWAAITETFGATLDRSYIDAARTLDATARATARVAEVGAGGGRIAFASAAPASLLTLHGALADVARTAGAEVPDLADVGPLRADGRMSRSIRWVGGVAVVTDGHDLYATRDGEAARERLFVVGRPSLVVADGPFAEVAWEAGIEVVTLAGLDRSALAVASARRQRCVLVPLRTDRAPRAYAPITDEIRGGQSRPISTEL